MADISQIEKMTTLIRQTSTNSLIKSNLKIKPLGLTQILMPAAFISRSLCV